MSLRKMAKLEGHTCPAELHKIDEMRRAPPRSSEVAVDECPSAQPPHFQKSGPQADDVSSAGYGSAGNGSTPADLARLFGSPVVCVGGLRGLDRRTPLQALGSGLSRQDP
ncbi:hypothetical protein, partial [Actinoplanes sp. NPDC026670]|uniref:hypothetical protein n=1 Tax=Actinoplanes sp. NPDC026670 TaxID=3154700 RepID=UPI0033FEED26